MMKKINVFYFITGALLITLLLLVFFMKKTIAVRKDIDLKIEQNIQDLKIISKKSRLQPKESVLGDFSIRENELKDKYISTLKLLKVQNTKKSWTPLQFKEELLKIQDFLKERARIWNIHIPKAVGFQEFEAGGIPDKKSILLLVHQLHHIRSILSFMIESKVEGIDSIYKKISKPDKKTQNLNVPKIYTYEIKFSSSWNSFIQVLYRVYSTNQFFVVKKIDLQRLQKDNNISVIMVIESYQFDIRSSDNVSS